MVWGRVVSEGWDTSGESVIMNRFPGLGCQELVSVDHMEALGRSDVAKKTTACCGLEIIWEQGVIDESE